MFKTLWKFAGALTLGLLMSATAYAGGGLREGIAMAQVGTSLRPVPGGRVRVCTMPTSGTPCNTLAHIYRDIALTDEILPQGIVQVDSNARYTYFAEATVFYQEQVTGAGISTRTISYVGMTGAGGGGGGASTSATYVTVGAEVSLPSSRRLVAGTNTTVDTSVAGQIKINAATAGSGTITSPTYWTSGFPSYDYVCTGDVLVDTPGLQAQITAAEIAGSGLAEGPGGPVNLIGIGDDCQIDGTLITIGAYRHSSPLIIQFKGRTVLRNGGFRTTIAPATPHGYNVKFIGGRGGDALSSFGYQNAEITVTGSPNFSSFLITAGTNIDIDGLTIRGFGTEPVVKFTTYDVSDASCYVAPCGNTQNRIHDTNIINGASSGVPLYIGTATDSVAGFNFDMWGLTLASFSSSYHTLHIKNIGDIRFAGQPQSWLLNGGIEIEDTCGGCTGVYVFENIATEAFDDADFLTMTGPVGVPVSGSITLRNIYLSDTLSTAYIINAQSNAHGSPIGPIYMYDTAFAAATAIFRPTSLPIRFVQADSVFPEYYKSLSSPKVGAQTPPPGFISNTGLLKAQVDDNRRTASPSVVRYANIVTNYLPGTFVQTGFGTGTLTTTGIADPWGGTIAARIVASSAPWGVYFYDQNIVPVVGDVWIARLAVKANNANGFTNFVPNMSFAGSGITTVGFGFNYLSPSTSPVDTNTDWQFLWALIKVTVTDGGTKELLFRADLNATALSLDIVAPLLVKIPAAAALSDSEILDYAMKLTHYSDVCAIGDLCLVSGKATGANVALSNLSGVSINTTLLAQSGVDLGSTAKPFKDLYLYGSGTYATTYFKITGTPTGTRVLTLPNTTGLFGYSAAAITAGDCIAAGSNPGELVSAGVGACGSGGGGGVGTVTSFSAADLSPLFTTSEANPTTTPALTFTLSNASANTVFANCTGGATTPSYCSLTAAMLPATAALTNLTLAQFAATTSAQLRGVLSDETGGGSAVFADAPVFATSLSTPTVISTASNPAATGLLRGVNNAALVCGRNAANGADLCMTVTSGDLFSFGTTLVPATAAGFALGSTTLPWSNLVIGNASGQTVGFGTGTLTANRTITVPNANTVLPVAITATSNNFLTGLDGTTGVFTRAQPSFSNISSTLLCSQMPVLTGVISTAGGTCTTTGSSITLETNGSNNTSQSILDLTNTAGGAGISFTNPSGGIVQASLTASAGGGATALLGTLTSLAAGDYICGNSTPILVNCTPGVSPNSQTGTSYTYLTTDRGKVVWQNNGSATAYTLPQAGSAGFAGNWYSGLFNVGAGLVTITPTTSTINGAATAIVPQNWFAVLHSDNTNYRSPILPTIGAFPNCTYTITFTSATGAFACGFNPTTPGAIGGTTPGAATFTTLTANTSLVVGGGTAVTKIITGTNTLDFANQAAIGCEVLTITVTGAASGDSVELGVPNGSNTTNSVFWAWASAADTVSVKHCAVISGDPASGTFRATIVKF